MLLEDDKCYDFLVCQLLYTVFQKRPPSLFLKYLSEKNKKIFVILVNAALVFLIKVILFSPKR